MGSVLMQAARGKARYGRLRLRQYSQQAQIRRPTFGIAFDIDGVLLRGNTPIGGAPRALRRLYKDPDNPVELHVPFVLLTNGGGMRESLRASELSNLLGVQILSHQVLCDVLRSGGLPGKSDGCQPPLFFASDDLEYQGAFPVERLGMGAFRIALQSIFNRIHNTPLTFISFGKPNVTVFKDAEIVLHQLSSAIGLLSSYNFDTINGGSFQTHQMRRVYMVGDNPAIDIYGASQAGQPWFSILTRTGCFKGEGNHERFPADLVVDTVEDAIDYILKQHSREYP